MLRIYAISLLALSDWIQLSRLLGLCFVLYMMGLPLCFYAWHVYSTHKTREGVGSSGVVVWLLGTEPWSYAGATSTLGYTVGEKPHPPLMFLFVVSHGLRHCYCTWGSQPVSQPLSSISPLAVKKENKEIHPTWTHGGERSATPPVHLLVPDMSVGLMRARNTQFQKIWSPAHYCYG